MITNGFARVFTGWTWHQALQASGQLPTNFYPATDWLDPMVMVKNYHELGTKTLLDNVVLPAAVGYSPTASAGRRLAGGHDGCSLRQLLPGRSGQGS